MGSSPEGAVNAWSRGLPFPLYNKTRPGQKGFEHDTSLSGEDGSSSAHLTLVGIHSQTGELQEPQGMATDG
jgi:hypothetical protein